MSSIAGDPRRSAALPSSPTQVGPATDKTDASKASKTTQERPCEMGVLSGSRTSLDRTRGPRRPSADLAAQMSSSKGTPATGDHGIQPESVHSTPETAAAKAGKTDAATSAAGTHAAAAASEAAKLQAMETRLKAWLERDVDTASAATLINNVRRYGPRAHKNHNAAASNKQLMAGISNVQADAWLQAQGADAQLRSEMRSAAFLSEMFAPLSGDLANVAQFVVAPLVGAATEQSWAGAGIGIAASLGQVPAAALQHPGFITMSEHVAERKAPLVKVDEANVNYKHPLRSISPQALAQAQRVETTQQQFAAHLAGIEAGIQPAGGTADNNVANRVAALLAATTTEEGKAALLQQANNLLDAVTDLHDLQFKVLMTEGGEQRQEVGNAWQFLPRSLRSLAAGLVNLATGTPEAEMAAWTLAGKAIERVAQLSPMQVAGVQAGVAGFFIAGQHVLAGFDGINKQDIKSKLNLMYADVFTDEGKRKWQAGEDITQHDIDPAAMRKLLLSKDQSLAKRAAGIVDVRIKEVQAEIAALQPPAAGAAPAAAGADADVENQALGALRQRLAELEGDKDHLKSGDLSRLTPGGEAATLLAGAEEKFFSPLLWEDLKKKYNTPGELMVQMAQRTGQAFHGVFFGSGVASPLVKVINAIQGGASHVSSKTLGGLSALSFVLAGVGAYFAPGTITIKNNGKEAEEKMGLVKQTALGIGAGGVSIVGKHRAGKANAAANQALDQHQNDLAVAVLLKAALQPAPVDETAVETAV
jgi:hypothetical protein